MMDTFVDVYELSGGQSSRAYAKTQSDIRVLILPASNEAVALNENVPQGQLFQFKIEDVDVVSISQQSKFIVTDSQISGFDVDDEFIVMGDVRKIRGFGRYYITGVCYKKK